jgi:hypothetical protein
MMEPAVISSNRREKHALTARLENIRSISMLLRRLRSGIITLIRVSIAHSAVVFMKMRRVITSSIYTLGGPFIYTGIVGLDASGNVAFNYQYDELDFCGTAWNAIQIHWEDLRLE